MKALEDIYIYIVRDIFRYIEGDIYRYIAGDIYRYIVGDIYRYIVGDITIKQLPLRNVEFQKMIYKFNKTLIVILKFGTSIS